MSVDDLDLIAAKIADLALPDDVGRMVLTELAKMSDGHAGRAARRLLDGCVRQRLLAAPLLASGATAEPTPDRTAKSSPQAD